jgi:Domain of unknown function (DUF4351)
VDTIEVLEQTEKKLNKKPTKNEFDSPWKRILDLYFEDFMALCWPEKHALIDWDKDYTMLDKELLQINKDAAITNKTVDKLIEIHCKEGDVAYLILHLEIQRTANADFTRRMFQYRYRLRDLYDKPIASLAILIDNNPHWRPTVYREALWGSSLEMRFPILKLIDYEAQRAELEASPNPFAAVILAQLAANRCKGSNERLDSKKALTWHLYRKGWSRDKIVSLCTFLDWVIALPKALEPTYDQYVLKIEEDLKVEYVTTFERLGIQKGLHQGESTILLRQLEQKFSVLPDEYRKKIQEADSAVLLEWAVRLLDSQSLEELFRTTT